MRGCKAVKGLIVCYATGRLEEDERLLVETHAATCPTCAELLRFAFMLRKDACAPGSWHPDPELIVCYAESVDAFESSVRSAIEEHLPRCPACRLEIAILRAADRQAESGAAEARRSTAGRPRRPAWLPGWESLRRAVFRPIPAAIYASAALIAVGAILIKHGSHGPIKFVLSESLPGVMASQAAWGDFDGDGDPDVVICGKSDSARVTRVYENRGGRLVLHQNLPGIETQGSDCLAWGDYDNDGDLDLVMAGLSDAGPITRIYRNNGRGDLTWDVNQALRQVKLASLAWGDMDNDGDLDLALLGDDGTHRLGVLYKNDPPGVLSEDAGNPLAGIAAGSADWGDWDGDGDLDLLITGGDGTNLFSILYKNDPVGTLRGDGDHGLPGVGLSDAEFGDYDADGDLDLAITGAVLDGHLAQIYENVGGAVFRLAKDIGGLYRSSCAWGDYDGDGDLDVAFCGYTGATVHTMVFRNENGRFTPQHVGLPGSTGSVSWVDADGDGRLDIFLTGNSLRTKLARLYRNVGAAPNRAPSPPNSLLANRRGDFLYLTWGGAHDSKTPRSGLSYCLRVGTRSGGNDIVSGTMGKLFYGNMGPNETFILRRSGGTYYWSVQSIDSGGRQSDWSQERSFVDRSVGPGPG